MNYMNTLSVQIFSGRVPLQMIFFLPVYSLPCISPIMCQEVVEEGAGQAQCLIGLHTNKPPAI